LLIGLGEFLYLPRVRCGRHIHAGEVETSLHFFMSVLLWMYRTFWRKWGSTIAFQRPRFCVGVSLEFAYDFGYSIAGRHVI